MRLSTAEGAAEGAGGSAHRIGIGRGLLTAYIHPKSQQQVGERIQAARPGAGPVATKCRVRGCALVGARGE